MSKRIYLSPPYIGELERKYVQDAFDANWVAPAGPHLAAFEKEQCRLAQRQHGVALSSGTAAIHLALRWFGVGCGDYVFCSDLTFAGSCNPILYQRATPVFIDSEPDTWNMSPIALKKAFDWAVSNGKLPKAVIIVDLYGISADWDRLLPICQEFGIPVIEDSAEAVGSFYKGKPCGSFGDIGVFSYNGNKIVTTSGGGMLVTDDKAIADKVRFWSTQAREPEVHYEHKEYGYNYRLSNICAAIGLGQLGILDEKIAKRKKIQSRYIDALRGLPISLKTPPNGYVTNYWLSVATLDKNLEVKPYDIVRALDEANIECRPAWKPMHLQPVFGNSPFFTHNESVGERVFTENICLPSGEAMSELDIKRVTTCIRNTMEVARV